MKTKNITFKGFASPRYTQVPDELFDDLMAHLSGAELKVLLYVIRRTFGFKKDTDNISLSQICNGITTREGEILDKGTGLSLSTVQTALKGLISKNCVTTIRNRTKERGDQATTFSLNIIPLTEIQKGGIPKIGNGGYRKSVSQETVKQETDLQHRNSSIKIQRNISKRTGGHQQFQMVGALLKDKLKPQDNVTSISYTEIPESILAAVQEISSEFGESRITRSNQTHAARLFQESGKNENSFTSYLYEAKSITKQQGSVKKKMPYFFSVLEDLIGTKNNSSQFYQRS